MYKFHLFLMFSGGSVQYSPLGNPTGTWSLVVGAGELGVGDEGTGFKDVPGESLLICGRNSTWILSGTPGTDLALNSHSKEAGAIEHTIQRVSYPMWVDDNGLVELRTTNTYGDFASAALSGKIKSRMNALRGKEQSSIVVKAKNQYRIFYSDNNGFEFTFNGDKLIGIMPINYGIPVSCCSSSTDSSGAERLFFGSDNGYIYEMDSGTSFDGREVVAWIRPSFHHFKSPENIKRFFKVVLEIDADQTADLTFLPALDYGDPNQPEAQAGDLAVTGGGGYYDENNWDEFYYDAAIISSAYGYIDAVGKNFSLFIRSALTYEKTHTIQGAIIHYSLRGIVR